MNNIFANPMLGDTSSTREVVGAYEMPDIDTCFDDLLVYNPFAPLGNENMSTDLTTAVESHSSGSNMHKPVGDSHHVVTAPQPEGRVCGAPPFDDIETINKGESLREGQYEFRIPGYDTTYEMKDSQLFALPNKDIPIEVVGAQGGHVVKIGMRYTTGVHHDTPVLACKTHDDNDDAGFPFYVPKLNVVKMKDQKGHPTVEIPVPHNASDEGNFTFSVVFWCLNSCHLKYGKAQEMILKLCDGQDKFLTGKSVKLRICTNVARDKKLEGQRAKQGKKRCSSGGEGKGPALKKLKHEVQEGDEGAQAGETETPAPLQLLSPREAKYQVRCDPALVPILREFVKVLSRGAWIEMEEVVDGASPDPPPNME